MMEVVLMLAGAENGSPKLDRHHSRKPVRMRYGGPDRRYPGTPSGILRNVQPFLQGQRTEIRAVLLKKQIKMPESERILIRAFN